MHTLSLISEWFHITFRKWKSINQILVADYLKFLEITYKLSIISGWSFKGNFVTIVCLNIPWYVFHKEVYSFRYFGNSSNKFYKLYWKRYHFIGCKLSFKFTLLWWLPRTSVALCYANFCLTIFLKMNF